MEHRILTILPPSVFKCVISLSTVFLSFVPLYMMCLSLMTFKALLTSSQQFMFCLGVVFFIFILFGVIELLGSVSLFFIKSGKIFSPSFFLEVFKF